MPVNQPVILPHLEASPKVREHIQAVSRLDRRLVITVLYVMRREDIAPVVDEVDVVESHLHR